MHTDSGMTGISLSGYMPYMTVASLEMSDEPKNETSNVIPKPRTKNPRPVQAGIRIRTSRSKALFITNNQHLRRLPEASRIKYAQLLDHFVGIRNQFVRSFGMTRYDRHTTMPYGNLGQQA